MTTSKRASVACFAVLLGACGGSEPAAHFGKTLFHESRLSTSELNAVSCATCHSDEESGGNNPFLSGHSLYNSAFRPSYWGGAETSFLDAASFCFTSFMRGAAPFDPANDEAKALYEYLVSISPDRQAEALSWTVVKVTGDVPGGNVARGEVVYDGACRNCHGAVGSGEGRLVENAPVLPNVTEGYATAFPGIAPGYVVIEKVRHGSFFAVSGTMPPFGLESMAAEDLGALLAYLGL